MTKRWHHDCRGHVEGFTEIERWSVTKQGSVEAVQESYTGDRPQISHLKESAVPSKKGNGKRELIDTGADKRYVRRDAKGQFKESDDHGRSLDSGRTTARQNYGEDWPGRSGRPKAKVSFLVSSF